MVIETQALKDLKLCLSMGDCGFELFNYYKGVPFTCKATLHEVSEDRIFFIVQPPNSILLVPGMSTLLIHEGSLDPIRAQVLSFDFSSGIVEVGGFTYTSRKAGSRREVRLEPEKSWDVEIKSEALTTIGTITDISVSGLGVNLEQTTNLNRGDLVNLVIQLPTGTARMDGKIIKISTKGTQNRLAIEFTGLPTEKTPLVLYIFERSQKIRDEVQMIYEKVIEQPKSVAEER